MKKGYQGNVLLVELIVVVLFFSLSAVISLGVFVQARGLETDAAQLDLASGQLQQWSEMLQFRPDAEAFLAEYGFTAQGENYACTLDDLLWSASVTREDAPAGQLVTTRLSVSRTPGSVLLTQDITCYFPGEVR